MAFSTQKQFFEVLFLKESIPHNVCEKPCIEMKSYNSTMDDRSWSKDNNRVSEYLSKVVTNCKPQSESSLKDIRSGQFISDSEILNQKKLKDNKSQISQEQLKVENDDSHKRNQTIIEDVHNDFISAFERKVKSMVAAGKLNQSDEKDFMDIYNNIKNIIKENNDLRKEILFLKSFIEKLPPDIKSYQKDIPTNNENYGSAKIYQNSAISLQRNEIKQYKMDQKIIKDNENLDLIKSECTSLRQKLKSFKDLENKVGNLQSKVIESEKISGSLTNSLENQTIYIKELENEIKRMHIYYEEQMDKSKITEEVLKCRNENLKKELLEKMCETQKVENLQMELVCLRNELMYRSVALSDYDCQYKQLMFIIDELRNKHSKDLQNNETQTCAESMEDLAFYASATLEQIIKEFEKRMYLENSSRNSKYVGHTDDFKLSKISTNEQQLLKEENYNLKTELDSCKAINQNLLDKLKKHCGALEVLSERVSQVDLLMKNSENDNVIMNKHLRDSLILVKDISDIQLKNQHLEGAVNYIHSLEDQKICENLKKDLLALQEKNKKLQEENEYIKNHLIDENIQENPMLSKNQKEISVKNPSEFHSSEFTEKVDPKLLNLSELPPKNIFASSNDQKFNIFEKDLNVGKPESLSKTQNEIGPKISTSKTKIDDDKKKRDPLIKDILGSIDNEKAMIHDGKKLLTDNIMQNELKDQVKNLRPSYIEKIEETDKSKRTINNNLEKYDDINVIRTIDMPKLNQNSLNSPINQEEYTLKADITKKQDELLEMLKPPNNNLKTLMEKESTNNEFPKQLENNLELLPTSNLTDSSKLLGQSLNNIPSLLEKNETNIETSTIRPNDVGTKNQKLNIMNNNAKSLENNSNIEDIMTETNNIKNEFQQPKILNEDKGKFLDPSQGLSQSLLESSTNRDLLSTKLNEIGEEKKKTNINSSKTLATLKTKHDKSPKTNITYFSNKKMNQNNTEKTVDNNVQKSNNYNHDPYEEFIQKNALAMGINLSSGGKLINELRAVLDTFIQECTFCFFCNTNLKKCRFYFLCHKILHQGIQSLTFKEIVYMHKKIYMAGEKSNPGYIIKLILKEHHNQNVDERKCCNCKKFLCCTNSEEMLKEKVCKLEQDIHQAKEYLDNLRVFPDTSYEDDIDGYCTKRKCIQTTKTSVQKYSTKQIRSLKARILKCSDMLR